MKQFTILLISLTVLNLTSYTQTTLINTSKIENDTASIALNELISLSNHAFADLDACNELADSLHAQIINYELLKKKDDELLNKSAQIEMNSQQQLNLQGILLAESKIKSSKLEKQNTRLKIFRNTGFIIAGLEACYIGVKMLLAK